MICKYCFIDFPKKRKNGQFCSRTCSGKYRKEQKKLQKFSEILNNYCPYLKGVACEFKHHKIPDFNS